MIDLLIRLSLKEVPRVVGLNSFASVIVNCFAVPHNGINDLSENSVKIMHSPSTHFSDNETMSGHTK